ncbi:MAG: GNAT family N-acetyltransferase [Xanthomonadales bacterium]|nr:GNAT family N-acetyltransferase [Xanthomonadales bacterium]
MSSRPAVPADIPAIRHVLQDTALFPSELLEELIHPFFHDDSHGEHWFVHDSDREGVIGFGFVRPEPLADGTWNLVAIGVRNHMQGRGVGAAMMRYVEEHLADQRVLIVETSSVPEYARTRRFYSNLGFAHEATIRDYWAAGDDKVIFWKAFGV